MTEIKRARILAGLTQQQAADRIGMDRSTLSRLERSGHCDVDTLRRMAEVYHAPQLLVGAGCAAFGDTPAEALAWLREEAQEALAAVERLDEAVRHGRAVDIALAGQVWDLYTALGAFWTAVAPLLDIDAVRRAHEQKLRRYLRGGDERVA
ncbi:MAG: helix-turn-helix transcriptional regulator [Sphaerobacter sp.]|nr:helix-turn-helix transcriptional regulator [Sphaerobacter sp.]